MVQIPRIKEFVKTKLTNLNTLEIMNTYTNNIVRIADKLNANFEGFTINLKGEKPQTTKYTERYICGGFAPELKIKYTNSIKRGQQIYEYINLFKTNVLNNKGLYFGIWLHEGYIYVDVCKAFDSKDEAIKCAKLHNELAIYDAFDNVEINVNKINTLDMTTPTPQQQAKTDIKNLECLYDSITKIDYLMNMQLKRTNENALLYIENELCVVCNESEKIVSLLRNKNVYIDFGKIEGFEITILLLSILIKECTSSANSVFYYDIDLYTDIDQIKTKAEKLKLEIITNL